MGIARFPAFLSVLPAAVLAAAVLAGCDGSDRAESVSLTPLEVDDVARRVAPAVDDSRNKPCPLPPDMSSAANAAGITGAVAPDTTDPVSVETSDSAEPGDRARTLAPAMTVECRYTIGGTAVTTFLVVTGRTGAAAAGAVPEMFAFSGATRTELEETQDHVLVAAEPADQRAGVLREGVVSALVVSVAAGERTEVVVTDPGQDLGSQNGLPGVARGARGVVRGARGVCHRVGHRHPSGIPAEVRPDQSRSDAGDEARGPSCASWVRTPRGTRRP
ncbi:hypothetical protein [Frankia sp. AiPa1]|uniref:hypothetical protein n=1 Tax=Frankia sp. AiPa1 TaxID=573492 RepID=UPI0035A85A63